MVELITTSKCLTRTSDFSGVLEYTSIILGEIFETFLFSRKNWMSTYYRTQIHPCLGFLYGRTIDHNH